MLEIQKCHYVVSCHVSHTNKHLRFKSTLLVGLIRQKLITSIKGHTAFAKKALELMEKSPTSVVHARPLFAVQGFVSPWTVPLVQWLKPLLHAYHAKSSTMQYGFGCWTKLFLAALWDLGS
jgi:hypothetical protein